MGSAGCALPGKPQQFHGFGLRLLEAHPNLECISISDTLLCTLPNHPFTLKAKAKLQHTSLAGVSLAHCLCQGLWSATYAASLVVQVGDLRLTHQVFVLQ